MFPRAKTANMPDLELTDESWEEKSSQISLGRRLAKENDPGILHKLKTLPLRVWSSEKQQLTN